MKKTITLTTLILLFPLIASAMTLEEYVANLDTSYYDGTINITSFTDQLTDTNNNNINDTLTFTLTTDYATEDNLTAELIFTDESIPVLSQTKFISSSSPSFTLNISSYYLKESKYTYYARIYNQIGQIVYESKKINTSTLTKYETGTNITSITDENINNNFIRITLNLNTKRNETVNISVNLKYNNSIISGTLETALTTPSQSIQINIDNETLKSTHYTGTYNITSIVIGSKIIETEYTTSEYNYEDFAKTSYIKSYSDSLIDTNDNNLSDLLEINFSLVIKTAGTYNLESELRDLEGNYIALINHTETLSTGTQTLTAYLNCSEIYKTYTNGPYTLNYAKLTLNSEQKDITYNAYTTGEIYYQNFERPLLPDLYLSINSSYSQQNNQLNISINISNIGKIPAFNIFLDIFDNKTYENQTSIPYLNAGQSIILNYKIKGQANDTIITAIADFENLVDEIDESNNIAQSAPIKITSLSIPSLTTLYSNHTQKTFRFIILNNADAEITDIYWTFEPGDHNIIHSQNNITSLTKSQKSLVFLEYNYSGTGSYNVQANATGSSAQASLSSRINIGDLLITSLQNLFNSGTISIFKTIVLNNMAQGYLEFNWSLDTGDNNTITSAKSTNLSSNKTSLIFAEYDYNDIGNFDVTAQSTSGNNQDSKTISITILNITDLQVTDFTLPYSNSTLKIFRSVIQNTAYNNQESSWKLDTGEDTISSTRPLNLSPANTSLTFIQYNYPQTGEYNALFEAISTRGTNSKSLKVDSEDIEIYNLEAIDKTTNEKILKFIIKNFLNSQLTTGWQLDTKDNQIINSTNHTILQPQQISLVFIGYNFSGAGTFNINATAINNSLSDSQNLTITV